ncbi:MAG: DUF6786 family protein [Planctomycetota bacterium]
MPFHMVREFLTRHTHVVELEGDEGARVLVCPQWQGRVMTSTCGGDEGRSFGFVNRQFVEAGKHDPRFNNYGGEERLWLSPEGGPFSLWFKPGDPQTVDTWLTPPALNEGGWKVVSGSDEPLCRMQARMALVNAAGTNLLLDVDRSVRMLARNEFAQLFGQAAAGALARGGAKLVGYESVNCIVNHGEPLRRSTGLVSIWMLSMLNSGSKNVVIVPYKPGDAAELGPIVISDYFGPVPAERLNVLPEAVLFRADAKYRAKIGISPSRALDTLGAIDFASGTLTLLRFTMPPDAVRLPYMNNAWGPQKEPYVGEVVNSYNDGPDERGEQLGAFYELESLSPAAELGTSESLTHVQQTVHIQADSAALSALAREVLGVDLAAVQREMLTR